MQFVRAMRGIASACLVSVLVACGGGGGGDPVDYPADNTVRIDTGTSATPAGVYTLDQSTADTGTQPTGDGRTIEYAAVIDTTNTFQVAVAFLQNDSSKYILYVDDDLDDYACRSSNLSTAELQALAGSPVNELPVCSGTVRIDAGAHRLQASKVTVTSPTNNANKIVVSANAAWTL